MDNDTDWETGQSENIDQETDWEADWETDWETDGPQAPARPLSPEEEYHAVGLEAMAPQAGKTPPQAPNQAPNRAKTLETPASALHNYARQGSELDCGQAAMTANNATDNQRFDKRFDKRFDNRPYNASAKPGSRLVLDALLELRKEPWKLGNSFMPPHVAASSAAQKAYPGISSSAPDAPRASNPEPSRVAVQAYDQPQAPPQAHPEAPAGAHAQPSPDRPRTRPEGSSGTSGASLTAPGTPDSTPLPPEQQYGRMYGNLESMFMADPGYAELTKNPMYADMHRMQMQHTMLNQAGMAAAFDTIAKTLEPILQRERLQRIKDAQAYSSSHFESVGNTHPDAREIAQSGAISRWIEGLPQGIIRDTYANVLQRGLTGDVIELFNQFKRSTGQSLNSASAADETSRALTSDALQKLLAKSDQDALEAAKIKQVTLNKRLERLAPVRSKGTRPGLGGSGHADDYDYHAGWLEAMAEMRAKGEL